MLKRLIEYLKEALRKMLAYQNITDAIDVDSAIISDVMSEALERWRLMYKDNATWLSDEDGIYSMGLAQTICSELATLVLDEMKSMVVAPGQSLTDNEGNDIEIDTSTRAGFLNDIYHKNLLDKLSVQLEKGMAMGGMIIKPYITGEGNISFDFISQGSFYPICFDDEGKITDIAFPDQFIQGNKIYTKVERQTFANNRIVVENKVYVSEITNTDDSNVQPLGMEIDLKNVSRWANIEPEVTIDDVEAPLYGFYRVPLMNTVDMNSPLGISVFENACKLIERADRQFSRLDWEYEGGQIAIDVDPTAIQFTDSTNAYFGGRSWEQDTCKRRIYRGLELGDENSYNAFTPALRDNNYLGGLSRYLMLIEDKVGLARGTLSDVQSEAKTATEIRSSKQKTFITVQKNQTALERALKDCIYAANVYASLYGLSPEGDYELNTEWSDSVLTDTDTELAQRVSLMDKGVLTKAEVRSWYTGEDLETAQARIDEQLDREQEREQSKMMDDLFSTVPSQGQQTQTRTADKDAEKETEKTENNKE